MYRRMKSHNSSNEYNNCNSQGNQIIVLGAIISAIIYQEIQDDDELNTIGNLFVAVGGNILVGVAQRSACSKSNTTDNANNENTSASNTNLPVRSQRNNKMKKVKKTKKMKKVKKQKIE